MAPTPSLLIKKTTQFVGRTQTWSNRYHFSGGTPADSSAWASFADAVVAAEKAVVPSDVTIVEAVGYDAGSDIGVWSKAYSVSGTLDPGTGVRCPGDCAALVRYATTQRTSKNHPIYLFNYYHDVFHAASGADDFDVLCSAQVSALETYAAEWVSGFSPGYIKAGPNGAVAQSAEVAEYITHRDFPR